MNVIKILFIDESVEAAEQIISLLRNGGIAVRPARATTLDELRAAMDEQVPDVVLLDPGIGSLKLPEALHELDASGRDLASVAMVSQLEAAQVAELYAIGVRAVGLRSHPKQLLTVVRREFEALNGRRQLRRLETALRESERRCSALLDSSTDAIAYVHEGMHVRANRAYLEAFGFADFDDILGLPLLDLVGPDDADAFKGLLKRLARGDKPPEQLELRAQRSDGSLFEAVVEFAHATFEGEPCLQTVFRRRLPDAQAQRHSQHDPVTGLLQRARALELIDAAVTAAAEGEQGQALLLVEPDNWQSIVASVGLGHTDSLLAAFAGRVRGLLGPQDSAGLLAEHTLGLLLRGYDDAAVQALATRLRQAVAGEIFDAGPQSLTITASIGGSLLGERNATAELLLDQAGTALRNAQRLGGDRCDLHDPAAREKADAEQERQYLHQLRHALEHEGFVLYHQPIISLQDAEGDFSEILLRVRDPQGDASPGPLLAIAEKHGLLSQIDRWVLGRSLDALIEAERGGFPTTLFAKLSTRSLQDAELLPWLSERLQQARLRLGTLVLEMPESEVVTTLRPVQEFVNAWKKLGGRFALEQFGSGLNSFQLLAHVDADYLKIDRSFMGELPQHPENQAKIAEICTVAREMKRQTVAEWVEDAASTSLLFACGVDFVQGNFLHAPQRLALTGAATAA